jgi:ADP-ribose pyrophosphatase YjhB (NUDIX family)
VSGHQEPGESFRECLIREVGEELGLVEGADFKASDAPRMELAFTAWSESAQARTHYVMALFDVELRADEAYRRVESDPANLWLTQDAIRSGHAQDDAAVSATMLQVLDAVGWCGVAP